MEVSFVDLKAQYNSIKNEIDKAINAVISETAFIGGKYVKEFERSFAELYGVKHCIAVANGTDSLFIIMKMLGIGPGDEVITTAYSWISSSETISLTGAVPVFVDIHEEYYTLREEDIESRITAKTKAILPVHIHGQVCNMDVIEQVASRHGLFVIEDCAQSHFSLYRDKYAGTMGIASSFSFYPGKNLGAYGDAGCILTNDDKLAEKCRMFANHGALVKHQHQIEGINSRLDGMQAAILSAKLPHILEWTSRRADRARYYDLLLKNVPQVKIPKVRDHSRHSYHLYVIKADRRNELQEFLKTKGIETSVHYPTALPNLPCYRHVSNGSGFPVATANQDVILSLPIYPELSNTAIEYVVQSIKEFYS